MSGAAIYVEGAGTVVAVAGAMTYAVRGRSSALLAPSVYRGARTRAAIALTFDDGPSESTPELLSLLARHDAPATFFQCGSNVRRLPDVCREVATAGYEIGNHTDSHPKLYFKSSTFIQRELAAAQETIAHITGSSPRFFRAPYGVRWFGLREAQARLNLMGVMWTTIGVDWKLPVDEVVARLIHGARNGAIFCLHDGRGTEARPDTRVTLEAVRLAIPKLIDRGFHFETISTILCPTKN
jgi:peptidoglycan/xylan/chitin deacetylase (PgdA/CDA1 family)